MRQCRNMQEHRTEHEGDKLGHSEGMCRMSQISSLLDSAWIRPWWSVLACVGNDTTEHTSTNESAFIKSFKKKKKEKEMNENYLSYCSRNWRGMAAAWQDRATKALRHPGLQEMLRGVGRSLAAPLRG